MQIIICIVFDISIIEYSYTTKILAIIICVQVKVIIPKKCNMILKLKRCFLSKVDLDDLFDNKARIPHVIKEKISMLFIKNCILLICLMSFTLK